MVLTIQRQQCHFSPLTHKFLDRFGLLSLTYLSVQPAVSIREAPQAGAQSVSAKQEGQGERVWWLSESQHAAVHPSAPVV